MSETDRKNHNLHKIVQDILENDLTCPVCREIYINPLILNCSHSFCKFCLYQWLAGKKTNCPQCRVRVIAQAENLALRNTISKLVQNSSPQFQQSRSNIVSQRLKDIEKSTKDLNMDDAIKKFIPLHDVTQNRGGDGEHFNNRHDMDSDDEDFNIENLDGVDDSESDTTNNLLLFVHPYRGNSSDTSIETDDDISPTYELAEYTSTDDSDSDSNDDRQLQYAIESDTSFDSENNSELYEPDPDWADSSDTSISSSVEDAEIYEDDSEDDDDVENDDEDGDEDSHDGNVSPVYETDSDTSLDCDNTSSDDGDEEEEEEGDDDDEEDDEDEPAEVDGSDEDEASDDREDQLYQIDCSSSPESDDDIPIYDAENDGSTDSEADTLPYELDSDTIIDSDDDTLPNASDDWSDSG